MHGFPSKQQNACKRTLMLEGSGNMLPQEILRFLGCQQTFLVHSVGRNQQDILMVDFNND